MDANLNLIEILNKLKEHDEGIKNVIEAQRIIVKSMISVKKGEEDNFINIKTLNDIITGLTDKIAELNNKLKEYN